MNDDDFWENGKDKIYEFAKDVCEGFTSRRILSELCKLVDYTRNHDNVKFVQIAERFPIDAEDFTSSIYLTAFAEDCGISIERGEIKYLLSKLMEVIKERKSMNKFTVEELNRLIETCEFIPTDMFVPLEYFLTLHGWYGYDKIVYEGSQLYLLLNNLRIKIHWSSNSLPFDEIILLDNQGIEVVQKRKEDMIQINGTEHYKQVSTHPYLEIQMGKHANEIDTLIRSVIGIKSIDKRKIKISNIDKQNGDGFQLNLKT